MPTRRNQRLPALRLRRSISISASTRRMSAQLLGRHTFQHRHALAPTPPFAVDKITDDPESNAHPHNLFEDFFYLISDTHNIIVL